MKNFFSSKNTNGFTFTKEDSSYLFTTENIRGYMPGMEGMNVLTVCASADHYLNAYLMGASNVDVFDINELTRFVLNLKKCALCYLDYEEFLDYFGISNINNVLDYKIYSKFSKYLDDETKYYFDSYYKLVNYNGTYLYYRTDLFYSLIVKLGDNIKKLNYYMDIESYYKLQGIMRGISYVNFISSDINELDSKLDCNYDFMFFSNIMDYQSDLGKFMDSIDRLKNYLNVYGSMFFGYLYDIKNNKLNSFANELVKSKEYYSILIKGYYDVCNEMKSQDKVLVYSKI